MARLINDTEENRYVDRIKAIAWREAKDAGASFITKTWIAARLHCSVSWVNRLDANCR